MQRLLPLFFSICGFVFPFSLNAAVFYVPDNGDSLVGQVQHVKAGKTDTLSEIAQRFDLGYNEIVSANPDVDPWLPAEGVPILIPTRFILPSKPWRGIVINLAEMRLYYFPERTAPQDKPLVYTFPIGIGRESWSTPVGNFHITEKIEHPVWTVPESVLAEASSEGRVIPWQVAPGEENPLGDYAMLLNEPGYMIHGTNKSAGVGRRVSHGCIRLYPEDISQLAAQVPRGTAVRIIDQPVAFGIADKVLYVESNHDADAVASRAANTIYTTQSWTASIKQNKIRTHLTRRETARVSHITRQAFSLPIPVKAMEVEKDSRYSLIVHKPSDTVAHRTPEPVYSPMVLVKLFGSKKVRSGGMIDADRTLQNLCADSNCAQYGSYTSHRLAYAYSEILKHGYDVGSYIVEQDITDINPLKLNNTDRNSEAQNKKGVGQIKQLAEQDRPKSVLEEF